MKQGLKENWKQFTLLVIVNAFVGAMVGMERSILPDLAQQEFGIASASAILSFIIVFGIFKSLSNYFAGSFANKIGRKKLLLTGWLIGLPVPIILIYAPVWEWVVFANILLGINQGLAWSSTVIMKIDLVGSKNRGLAMGLNESTGYLAIGLVAFLTSYVATEYGIRPYPFYLGIFFAIAGLLLSWLLVKDTGAHVKHESKNNQIPKLSNIFLDTSWRNKNLSSITQAGLINNLNDGMMWGLLPVLLAHKGFDLITIGKITALYPLVWGISQLGTGKLADILPKKKMLFYGMMLQAVAIVFMTRSASFLTFSLLAIVVGIGTALVYPTFLVAISDYTPSDQRAASIGVFRLWRDLGYSFGALLTGIIADMVSINVAVISVGLLTGISAMLIQIRMQN